MVYYTIQVKRGTAAEWTAADTLLLSGEIGYETDTGKIKFGNGVDSWNSLSYYSTASVSVAISGSDGIEVDSGSPITSSGTIALGVNKSTMLSTLNVEDGADVTDATNVASAGAVMDSDFSSNGLMTRTGAGSYSVTTAPSGTIVGTSDTQTLTNKSVQDCNDYISGTINAAASIGNIVYFDTSDWNQADASSDTTADGPLGIYYSSGIILTKGKYTTTGLTAGAIYYLSETAGGITTTAPTTSGAIVRVIGKALSTTVLYFNPSNTWVELT